MSQQNVDEIRKPWRVGRKVGRTIYNADDALIGVMDTREMAAAVVAAVNTIDAREADCEALREALMQVKWFHLDPANASLWPIWMDNLLATPNPGQALLDELAMLRKQVKP